MTVCALFLLLGWAAAPAATEVSDVGAQAASVGAAEIQGEVASFDAERKTLKLKTGTTADATEVELSVEEGAVSVLAELKAGDRVSVTCKEGTSGETCVATGVKKHESQ